MENIDPTEVNNHLTQTRSVENLEVYNSNNMEPGTNYDNHDKVLLRRRDLEIPKI